MGERHVFNSFVLQAHLKMLLIIMYFNTCVPKSILLFCAFCVPTFITLVFKHKLLFMQAISSRVKDYVPSLEVKHAKLSKNRLG